MGYIFQNEHLENGFDSGKYIEIGWKLTTNLFLSCFSVKSQALYFILWCMKYKAYFVKYIKAKWVGGVYKAISKPLL